MNNPCVLITVATSTEASPIMKALALSRNYNEHAFPVYSNNENSIHLIESGIGTAYAASAVSALSYCSHKKPYSCHLNIGVSGGQFPIGTAFQIHKIIDQATHKSFYPSTRHKTKIPSIAIETHHTACHKYPHHSLVDMESSGFYISASQFVANEQIGLLKIVSDNSPESLNSITKESVKLLMESNIDTIKNFINDWLQHSQQESRFYSEPPDMNTITSQHHFSTYQHNELKKLLQQWHALNPNKELPENLYLGVSSRNILSNIKEHINNTPVIWT